jgi:hypothetical protein
VVGENVISQLECQLGELGYLLSFANTNLAAFVTNHLSSWAISNRQPLFETGSRSRNETLSPWRPSRLACGSLCTFTTPSSLVVSGTIQPMPMSMRLASCHAMPLSASPAICSSPACNGSRIVFVVHRSSLIPSSSLSLTTSPSRHVDPALTPTPSFRSRVRVRITSGGGDPGVLARV